MAAIGVPGCLVNLGGLFVDLLLLKLLCRWGGWATPLV